MDKRRLENGEADLPKPGGWPGMVSDGCCQPLCDKARVSLFIPCDKSWLLHVPFLECTHGARQKNRLPAMMVAVGAVVSEFTGEGGPFLPHPILYPGEDDCPVLPLSPAAAVGPGVFLPPGDGRKAAPIAPSFLVIGPLLLFTLFFQRHEPAHSNTPLRCLAKSAILSFQFF